MKKRKSLFKYKTPLFFVLAGIFIIGLIWLRFQDITVVPNIVVLSKQSQKTFYPTLYSNTHITQNAIVSDPRFKDITIVDEESLLSNVISSVKKNISTPKSEGLENGTWLWTPLLEITPEYRTSIISGAKKNGIKAIYLSIDTYLDIFVMPNGPEKDLKKKTFDIALEDFIVEAHKNNISVDAEAGWQNWAEDGNSYKAYAVLNYVIQFNKTHKEKLRGFQYDVEPYMLSSFKNNKSVVLYNFISLIDQTVVKLNNSDLELSVVIPDFYDSVSGETPQLSYKGNAGYAFDHLLSVLERREGSKIIVMSYRNFSKGDDSSVDISKNEITEANTYHSKVIIAQETGDVPPPYVTFHNTTRSYYNKQVAFIQNTFASDKSFGGIAVHYVNAFLELK
ncbi:MAG: hypothetical protein NTX96_03370 [Candidatus Zambryskibacteria bacterium]|nr:hypothetical protein [Candidatus Zambryskibacteria bacterium]